MDLVTNSVLAHECPETYYNFLPAFAAAVAVGIPESDAPYCVCNGPAAAAFSPNAIGPPSMDSHLPILDCEATVGCVIPGLSCHHGTGVLTAQLFQQAQRFQPPVINVMQTPMMSTQTPRLLPGTLNLSSKQLLRCLAANYNPIPQEIKKDAPVLALSELEANITTALQYIPPPLEREKMGYMTLTPQFSKWLRGIDSDFLVIHEGETLHHSVLSTLSHLCGLMAKTMRTPGMCTLAFFCGLHTAAGTKLQGGKGLVQAITLQLLSTIQDKVFPTPIDPSTVIQRLVGGDLETICFIFATALGQLPAGMVFVLIDGAHWNGIEARPVEMRDAVRFLYKMVGKLRVANRGLVLKVLVTGPSARQRFDWNITAMDLYMERMVLAGRHKGSEQQVISDAIGDSSAFETASGTSYIVG